MRNKPPRVSELQLLRRKRKKEEKRRKTRRRKWKEKRRQQRKQNKKVLPPTTVSICISFSTRKVRFMSDSDDRDFQRTLESTCPVALQNTLHRASLPRTLSLTHSQTPRVEFSIDTLSWTLLQILGRGSTRPQPRYRFAFRSLLLGRFKSDTDDR